MKWRGLTAAAKQRAIDELKQRGRQTWGPTYYSQLAPPDLCKMAGRPREVQYGALISWLKRLGNESHSDPAYAIGFVAHLLGVPPDDDELTTAVPSVRTREVPQGRTRTAEHSGGVFEVNCPSVVHDHRFVVLGQLPNEKLHPAVLLQPQDGCGYWYPQVARHNPLRAGSAFCCYVRLGNPGGIWHKKKLPLDARVRVLALAKEWRADWSTRMDEAEVTRRLEEVDLVAHRECFVSRASVEVTEPTLSDRGRFDKSPLMFDEPGAESCVAPMTLSWKGGAAYIEIREGSGDRLLHGGTAASGATIVVRGGMKAPADAEVVFELDEPGRYRVRLYPAVWSFVDPPYEWWLNVR